MSKPKMLDAVDELDENGFYNNSTNLGDIRNTPTCLDNVLENGIYVFIGGENSPTDTTGSYKWSLRVYSSEDCTSVEQLAERLTSPYSRIVFTRHYSNNTWGSFYNDAQYILTKTLPSSNWSLNSELNAYEQTIEVSGLKANNRVDFSADVATLSSLESPIIPVNEDGILKAYTVELPASDITVQLTISTILKTS